MIINKSNTESASILEGGLERERERKRERYGEREREREKECERAVAQYIGLPWGLESLNYTNLHKITTHQYTIYYYVLADYYTTLYTLRCISNARTSRV